MIAFDALFGAVIVLATIALLISAAQTSLGAAAQELRLVSQSLASISALDNMLKSCDVAACEVHCGRCEAPNDGHILHSRILRSDLRSASPLRIATLDRAHEVPCVKRLALLNDEVVIVAYCD